MSMNIEQGVHLQCVYICLEYLVPVIPYSKRADDLTSFGILCYIYRQSTNKFSILYLPVSNGMLKHYHYH